MWERTFFLISSILLIKASAFEENELLGSPEIQCNHDTIEMQFKTRLPFSGKVYVKGHYNKPECRVDYSKKTPDGRPMGGIRLNHGACNMDRQRMITPEGMMFSTVLVISFHPLFVTKVDKAFNIKCMYKETARTVTAQIDVSALPTEPLHFDMPMPTCMYTIRKDNLDGPILKYARVGDQVVHRWECSSEQYGVLVHSCFVEDGQGEKQLIVDDKGCHTDRILLGDPTYVEALNMAYRESYVFKFADRVAVRFQCEIKLCLKEDGGCDGITPPLCFDINRHHVSERDFVGNNTLVRRRRGAEAITTYDADLISQYVYVLDGEDGNNGNDTNVDPAEALASRIEGVCMSHIIFTAIATVMAIIFILLSSVIIWIVYVKLWRVSYNPKKEEQFYS